MGLVYALVLVHELAEDVPVGQEAVVEVQDERHVFGLGGVLQRVGATDYRGHDALAVHSFAGVHPVEVSAHLVGNLEVVAKGEVVHLRTLGLAHHRRRPACLVDVGEVSVPVKGVDHGELGLLVVAVHCPRGGVVGVENLELQLLAPGEVVAYRHAAHEVGHIVHHVGVLVDFYGVEVELYTAVSGALLAQRYVPLSEVEHDFGKVDAIPEVVAVTFGVVPLVDALAVTVGYPGCDAALGLYTELLHLELPLVEVRAVPVGLEIAVHVEVEVEGVGLFLYFGDALDQALLVVGVEGRHAVHLRESGRGGKQGRRCNAICLHGVRFDLT